MGLLVNGQWQDKWYDTQKTDGKFIREDSQYRNWLTKDGSPGLTGEGGFIAEPGRYHLYVSLACPWAHRALIFRKLKNLDNFISVSVVHPHMLENGWSFNDNVEGATGDSLYKCNFLYEIYTKGNANYSGRVTVPILWDKQQQRIVNNESSDIIRMFNSAFNHLTGNEIDFYPEAKRETINAINNDIYHNINNGVYKCGFATKQSVYESAFKDLFSELDRVEKTLSTNRYLAGDELTEADWRLFTTLVRFDAVYVGHFKCNLKPIAHYHNIANYLRELYQYPGIKETVNMVHIKQHYYYSHDMINPTRIVPLGPELSLDHPHDRSQM